MQKLILFVFLVLATINNSFGQCATGFTLSNDGDVTGNHGLNDIWLVKINSAGTLQWQKCFGGSGDDFGRWIQLTSDGGYLINGPSGSNPFALAPDETPVYLYDGKTFHEWRDLWRKELAGLLSIMYQMHPVNH